MRSSGLALRPGDGVPPGIEGLTGGRWLVPVSRGLFGGGGGLSSPEVRLRRGASARLRSSEDSVRRRLRARTVFFSPSELSLEKRHPTPNRGDAVAPDRSTEDVASAGANLRVLPNIGLFFMTSPFTDWSVSAAATVEALLDALDRHTAALHALSQHST